MHPMIWKSFEKYRLVYSHLWKRYGGSWYVRFSYAMQLITRIGKLVALPVALSFVIARLAAGDFTGARYGVLLFVMCSALVGVMTPLIRYVSMRGENRAYAEITVEYFHRLTHADLGYFHSNLSGYLTTATRQYVDSCMQLVRVVRDKYMGTLLGIVFPLIVISWIDFWLGLVTLFLSLVQATYLLWASHALNPYRVRSREIYRKNSGRMADVISNILVVKAAAREDEYVEQVKEGARKEGDIFAERYSAQSRLIAVRECITVTFFLALLWLTVGRMESGAIGIGAAVLVLTYTATILTAIYALSDDVDEHDDIIDRIIPAFEILNRQNTVVDAKAAVSIGKARGDIEFDRVSFSYGENSAKPVLRDFSLKIPAGQKLGIVGLSGAGKSTLTKLLLRFEDASSGELLIDGENIKNILLKSLRSNIAYVPQEPMLFHTSIKENIIMASPKATEKEIKNALHAAHAWDFVEELPDGIESIVGERGVRLSGGQKQRIAIARAVLQRAPIMILDEATSALDSESEQLIKSSFAEILEGRTAIVVAHRLSTLSEMDRIIVIDDGQIAEEGTHETLLSVNGIYARLWKRQQHILPRP